MDDKERRPRPARAFGGWLRAALAAVAHRCARFWVVSRACFDLLGIEYLMQI